MHYIHILTSYTTEDSEPRAPRRWKTLHRPDLAGEEILDGSTVTIPAAIHKIMKDKWREHIPLTLLTLDYLRSPEASKKLKAPIGLSADGKRIEVVASANNGLITPKDETSLSLQEWLQAWANLLQLIDEHFPRATEAWESHWRMIWRHRERDSKWHCLLKYCIEVRKAATRVNLNPGIWQENIWQEIINEDRDCIAARRAIPTPIISTTSIALPRADHASHRVFWTRSTASAAAHSDMLLATAGGMSNTMAGPSQLPESAAVGLSTTNPSATDLTLQAAAESTLVQTHHTFTPCAKPQTTVPTDAVHDPRKVSTALLPDEWESELHRLNLWEDFKDVPTGLREGFRIGVHSPVHETYTPDNHKSALERPQVILDHINTEVKAGRYTGPYSRATLHSLIGPFCTAPLGVVKKSSAPGKFRIIQDFSFPRDSPSIASLNSQIDTSDFACTWGFFSDVANAIATLGPNARGATFDVDTAYRQIPVHPDDQPHIVFRWGDQYWVDCRVPFGAASSNGMFGHCGDAAAAIYLRRGFGLVFKWVDDFLFIQDPDASCAHIQDDIIF